MLAQQGYVVMSVDNRGTPAPRGRGWRKCLYRQIGVMTTADQAAAVKQIVTERPYLDPNRIAVWGWSGGGTMTLNAMFRYPDVYNTGIAVAPVSDFHLYDTVYEERYMGVPSLDAAEDYVQGSPITFAHQLAGNLLIIHGTGDDNVHYQSTERLVNELIKHNKPFSMMAYPNRSHAIKEGDNTQRHLYGLITRYLQQNL
jgi:dipeptidyl-peptidase-4